MLLDEYEELAIKEIPHLIEENPAVDFEVT